MNIIHSLFLFSGTQIFNEYYTLTIFRKEVTAMSDFGKGIMVILVILYIVSPVDFCPGPIDDLIVLLVGIAAQKGGYELEG